MENYSSRTARTIKSPEFSWDNTFAVADLDFEICEDPIPEQQQTVCFWLCTLYSLLQDGRAGEHDLAQEQSD